MCVPGERSSGTFFVAGTRGDFEASAFRRFSVEIAVSFRGPGKGTGISGILRDLIQSRGAPRRGKGKKPASRTKAGMPSPPSVRMKCGTKITPCGETPLGAASRKKHALEKRNSPAGTACRENASRVGRLRPSGAAHVRVLPQARASRRAWGYACFAPSGRGVRAHGSDARFRGAPALRVKRA